MLMLCKYAFAFIPCEIVINVYVNDMPTYAPTNISFKFFCAMHNAHGLE